jgi:hypothetical protein
MTLSNQQVKTTIDKFLLFYKGGKIEQVALRGIDIRNILPRITNRPFTIIFYHDIPHKLINDIIILFINQGAEYGKWCFIDIDEETNKIYFFDPYGNPPDGQWPILHNPEQRPPPEFKLSQYIRDLVENKNFKFFSNRFNVQGSIRNGYIADSACGEIILFRIMKRNMTDSKFYELCQKLGAKKIFDIIKALIVHKALFLKHYDYLLRNPEIFEIFFHDTAFSNLENKQNNVIFITGRKGSGKTETAKFLIYLYH